MHAGDGVLANARRHVSRNANVDDDVLRVYVAGKRHGLDGADRDAGERHGSADLKPVGTTELHHVAHLALEEPLFLTDVEDGGSEHRQAHRDHAAYSEAPGSSHPSVKPPR